MEASSQGSAQLTSEFLPDLGSLLTRSLAQHKLVATNLEKYFLH